VITKRRLNIALAILGVIVVIAVFVAARAGGSSSATGDASACNAYWAWYDDPTGATANSPINIALYDAYKEATTQPLISDLKALAEGVQGNTDVNTSNASDDIANICTGDGYADPAS
jgi:hypothetical protein